VLVEIDWTPHEICGVERQANNSWDYEVNLLQALEVLKSTFHKRVTMTRDGRVTQPALIKISKISQRVLPVAKHASNMADSPDFKWLCCE
jgi:hypothetical protein